jgi:hypothetical protein
MGLFSTYTHDSELQAITAPPLIHTLQMTTAHTKPQYFLVFPSRCLVTAHNNGDSSGAVLTPFPAG